MSANLTDTMTVSQLIMFLEDMPQDMPVLMSAPSRDRIGTIEARSIARGFVDEARVTWSDYHDTHILAAEDDTTAQWAVILGI